MPPLPPPNFLPGQGRCSGGSTRKDRTAAGEDLHKGATKISKDVLDSAGQQIPSQIRRHNSKKKGQGNEGRRTTRGKDRRTRPEQYGGVDGRGGVREDAAEHRCGACQQDELLPLLHRNPSLICFDRFEPSITGRVHIWQGVGKVFNVNKMVRARCKVKILIADQRPGLKNSARSGSSWTTTRTSAAVSPPCGIIL